MIKNRQYHDEHCIQPFLMEIRGYDDDVYGNGESRTVEWISVFCKNCGFYKRFFLRITKHLSK